ncbi:hypothetical protein K470DRAFT_300155 [Piedraia hortae CBS 480.64]|uniref:Exonuclease domain-containing protein n=1 Tax=Piedraia hortae CBS 480.64 TaxID=1314780 RepID=A0A6A7BX23_9PEZI|nr:hypothetical protein K470DRAFT_300155 [Piedraia hortae CBS 480.64]
MAGTSPEDGHEAGPNRKRRRKKSSTAAKHDNYPAFIHSPNARLKTYVKLSDLQNVVLYLLADGVAPQWIAVKNHQAIRKVVVLMVPGLEPGMFSGQVSLQNENEAIAQPGSDPANPAADADGFITVKRKKGSASPDDYYPKKLNGLALSKPLKPLADLFEHVWPVRAAGDSNHGRIHSPLASMLTTLRFNPKDKKRGSKAPSLPDKKSVRTPITEFIATTDELIQDGYILHPAHYINSVCAARDATLRETLGANAEQGWIDTPNIPNLEAGNVPEEKIQSGSITAGRHVLSIDCEIILSLTRLSVVDWNGKVVLDELVKPAEPITDYLTGYSGITEQTLRNVTTTLADAQAKLLSLLTPQTILLGHSLNSDLEALRITHPFIVDTAMLYPHPMGPPLKSKLKFLAKKYLSRQIQQGHGSTGHDSVEDAKAVLDLVKQKCEKGKEWGMPDANNEPIFQRLARSHRPKRDMNDPSGDTEPRVGAVVDWGDPTRGYGSQARFAIGCQTDAEVVKGVQLAVHGNDTDEVPRGGCDFVWARLRELEAYRGWWNKSKTEDNEAARNKTTDENANTSLADVVARTVGCISEIANSLPACTALMVYTGCGDPRPLAEMLELRQTFRSEYRIKKWDQLSVQWTDVEDQKLRRANETARDGLALMTVR